MKTIIAVAFIFTTGHFASKSYMHHLDAKMQTQEMQTTLAIEKERTTQMRIIREMGLNAEYKSFI